ncbi:hypothetical protein [Cryobacterium melibiosiphilum]|uniref:hypothetical protein n=1 Tax=Cryobacterium melibiosiphilum TaxID=995039 RepID=UPI001313DB20|nr:hypothetical protein [Cryobacterium melibiosiphilum]
MSARDDLAEMVDPHAFDKDAWVDKDENQRQRRMARAGIRADVIIAAGWSRG